MIVNNSTIFQGCIPALMTPCSSSGDPDWDMLVETGRHLMSSGMNGVVYCGSMGDWPLLSNEQRMDGVQRLVQAGIPTVVGTGAQNPKGAVELSAHARDAGAAGLMVIPRVLSRGISPTAQEAHFSAILEAGGELPAVIYNSPYYGFETKAELFFKLRKRYSNLVGFKEFGGADSLTYAAEHITTGDESLALMVGVDTQVFHGFVNCGAVGAITGVGNALPKQVLRLVELCQQVVEGNPSSRKLAQELDSALSVLSKFDEGPDLVLYYKELMVLEGFEAYQYQLNSSDQLSSSQKEFLHQQWKIFKDWWSEWAGAK